MKYRTGIPITFKAMRHSLMLSFIVCNMLKKKKKKKKKTKCNPPAHLYSERGSRKKTQTFCFLMQQLKIWR